ncbi:MAG: 3-dehydroquinate synthase [Chloroflexi bacterium]|nr:3-dehydroquinate synthase [Chloroflexota bacterium]
MTEPTPPSPQSAVFLYGPSGTGKSVAGRLLAQALDLPFLDLDVEIERRAGMSIPQIFDAQGESRFRALERDALLDAASSPAGQVIALGGGALLDPRNRELAETRGQILSLQAAPETLFARLQADSTPRPLLSQGKSSLRAYLQRRAAHYASFGPALDTTHLTPEQAVQEAQIRLGRFHVRGMGAGYDVRVRSGGLKALGELLRAQGTRGLLALVSDENVGALYAQRVQKSLERAGYRVNVITLPAGEEHKTLATVAHLWTAFLESELERGSMVVALGGGVVNDLAGFAAATYLRGIPWATVPTSLLAMVDASLGGKTGADLPQGKNLIGAFHAPRLVLADPETLTTLPEAELRSGTAEAVKHGIIGDPALFQDLTDVKKLPKLIARTMAVKIRIIQADPYEGAQRAALNLGHTIGHAVESVSGYRLRHGEAVAIGMVAEARLSESLGLADSGLAEHIAAKLRGLGLPTEIPPEMSRPAILKTMRHDKKKRGGAIRFALPVEIGRVKVNVRAEDRSILSVLD